MVELSFDMQTGGVTADSVECGISGKYEKNGPCKQEVAAFEPDKGNGKRCSGRLHVRR